MYTFVILSKKETQIIECLQELLGIPMACLLVHARK